MDPVPTRATLDSPACPVCGAGRRRRVAHLTATDVFECAGCDLVVCDPLPTMASASAGAASVLTEERFTASILAVPAAQAARYDALARARHHRYRRDLGRARFRLLEIGCGAAGLAGELGRLGVAYHGLDLDPRPVEAARARGVTGLRVGDFLELPDEEPYDVVCLSQVLEHITRPRDLIAKICRWLVPGGLIHVDVPHHGGLAGLPSRLVGGHRDRFGAIEWPHHAFAYRPLTLARLLAPSFEASTFTAAPDHPLWGQAVVPTPITRAYYAASRLAHARSLVIGYGPRRG